MCNANYANLQKKIQNKIILQLIEIINTNLKIN